MSEEAIPQTSVVPPATESLPTRPEMEVAEVKGTAPAKLPEHEASVVENAKGVATSEGATAPTHAVDIKESTTTNDEQSTDTTQNKPAISPAVAEMKEGAAEQVDRETGEAAPTTPGEGAGAQASAGNSKARRKSGGVPEHKGKKLSKKASKAKMTHIDAKPGDYFMVRLKGYPPWPGIICDESMLPASLLKSRPITAAGPDGTYRADYQDGGSKAKDRTFPVMYLYTNEFGWVPNTDLNDLDFDTVADIQSSVRKDLYAAHQLAAEKHDLDYFKQILKSFMEQRAADLQAKEAAKEAAKAAKKASKTKKQSKAAAKEDGDIEMADAPAEADSEGAEATGDKPKKSKKRKAEEDGLTDSAKKPKTVLKLTNTPKSTSTPKTPKDQSASKSKPKPKKAAAKPKEPEAATPKEPEMTEEEKRVKKEKEILFLRHRLQKGLLLKDQEPKAEEMLSMSEFIAKLEGYADLEVSIIRATKINKVLKAILKLGTIPKEEEFNFKSRSQALLDKWNKLLAVEQDTPPTPATNGVKQDTEATNGVKERATNENADTDTALGDIKSKEEAPGPEGSPKPPATEPTAVEATD